MNRSLRQSATAIAVGVLAVTGLAAGINGAGTAPPQRAPAGEGQPGALGAHLQQLKRAAPGVRRSSRVPVRRPRQRLWSVPTRRARSPSPRWRGRRSRSRRSSPEPQRVSGSPGRRPGRQAGSGTARARRSTRSPSSATPATTCPTNTWPAAAPPSIADRADVHARQLPAVHHPGRRRRLAHQRRAATPSGWTYLGGPLGINAAGAVTIDRNDPTGDTIYVGTGEANVCGPAASPASASTSRPTVASPGPARSARPSSGGKGIGEIIDRPRRPRARYTSRTTTALRGMSSCLLHRRHPARPRRRQVGPLQVHRRRRDLDVSSTTGRPTTS